MKIEQQISLAPLTTFRIGGPADYFARVSSTAELIEALRFAGEKGLPIFVLGGGSNILFADSGFRGLVIKNEIGGIEFDGEKVVVGSGTPLAQLVNKTAISGFSGLENMIGLPGTVGGAIAGNAGSYGQEIGTVVESARLVNLAGEIQTVKRDWFEFAYRRSRLKNSRDLILSSVTLKLLPTTADLTDQIAEIAKTRAAKEPGGQNAGSFWTNPAEGKKAWELIDEAGLRGATVGDSIVSEKHANYLINRGKATAAEVLELAKKVEQTVQAEFGVQLQREVRVVPA